MAKLLTHHDPYHIHAFFGLLNVINMIIRIGLLYLDKDDIQNAGFGYDVKVDIFSIFIMTLPFLSSFLFTNTPTKKVKNDGFTIWKEYRLHAAIFGLRSCLLLGLKLYEKYNFPEEGMPHMKYMKIAIVFSSLVMSKTATDSFPKQESTIRGMYKNSVAMTLAGFMQYVGHASVMLGLSPEDDIGAEFMFVVVIQLNAFNMTLRKKRISGPVITQAFYSFLLGGGFYLFVIRRFWAKPPVGLLDDRLQFVYAAVVAYTCRRSGFDRFSSWITGLVFTSCLYNESLLPGLIKSNNFDAADMSQWFMGNTHSN